MLQKIMNLHLLLYCMAAFGAIGVIGMFATHLTYRRVLKKTNAASSLKVKWLNLWKTRDKLLNRMNLMVWFPSLFSVACLGLALFFTTKLNLREGLPLYYLYMGTAVPVGLLLLRYVMDFTYKEELIMNSLADYIVQEREITEEAPLYQRADPALQEEIVDRITESIRQTAATGSHFSKMLSAEEEEIMREIIREFMQ